MKPPITICAVVASGFFACNTLLAADPTTGPAAPPAVVSNEPLPAPTVPMPAGLTPIFDGQSLDGWVQYPLPGRNFVGGDIIDMAAFVNDLTGKADPVSDFLWGRLSDDTKQKLGTYTADMTAKVARPIKNALAADLSKIIAGPSIYDATRFQNVQLSQETQDLLKTNPTGDSLLRLNRMLIDDAYPKIIGKSLSAAWVVQDNTLYSTGAGRGVLYTTKQYSTYRVMFDMRHISGGHQACVLVFCVAPSAGQKTLDALGGIQFQVPNGSHWDYRPGHNTDGKALFNNPAKPKFDVTQWSRVEILVDSSSGKVRMAVAQPPGSKAIENLDFDDSTAARTGPFAIQMHQDKLHDQYANVCIEENPTNMELISTK